MDDCAYLKGTTHALLRFNLLLIDYFEQLGNRSLCDRCQPYAWSAATDQQCSWIWGRLSQPDLLRSYLPAVTSADMTVPVNCSPQLYLNR